MGKRMSQAIADVVEILLNVKPRDRAPLFSTRRTMFFGPIESSLPPKFCSDEVHND